LIGSNIAKRYARAFFEIAKEERRYEDYFQELDVFPPSSRKTKA